MSSQIRQPQQERSIETKQKIINSAYHLFAEVGYFSTNTVEIAKHAGVSTGIIYGYFKDKRDILLDVLEVYISNAFDPILNMLQQLKPPILLEKLIPQFLDYAIKTHKKYAKMHETLHSLAAMDKEVNSRFIQLEDIITLKIAEKLDILKIDISDKREKIHLAMNIIQSFSHESVFDKHEYIDYQKMTDIVCNTVINLFDFS